MKISIPLTYLTRSLLAASFYTILTIPIAHACLPESVIKKNNLHNICPEDEIIKVRKDGKYGFIDRQGNLIVDYIYDGAEDFKEGMAIVEISDDENREYLWGAIDKSGNEVIEIKHENPLYFSEGLAPVKKDDKWGYIDRSGKRVIDYRFYEANGFKSDHAIVSYKYSSQIINEDSHSMMDSDSSSLEELRRLNDNLLIGRVNGVSDNIIDYQGNVYHKFSYINFIDNFKIAFNETIKKERQPPLWYMLETTDTDKKNTYHLMNNKGDIVFENLVNSRINLMTVNGMTVIERGSHLQVIDAQGKIRLSGDFDYIYPFIKDDLAIVKKDDKFYYYRLGLADKNSDAINVGTLAFNQGFDDIGLFNEGWAFAKESIKQAYDGKNEDNGQKQWRGFIDKSGNKVQSIEYEWVAPFYNGLAIYLSYNKSDNQYGVMNKQGQTIIPAIYTDINQCGNYFIVDTGDGLGLIDANGIKILDENRYDIECYGNFIVTTGSDRAKLIKLNTMEVYPHEIYRMDDFIDSYAKVTIEKPDYSKAVGFVTTTGEITLIEGAQYGLKNLGEGLFSVKMDDDVHQLINAQNETITSDYDDFEPVIDGYIAVSKNGLWGVIDTIGNEVLAPTYKEVKVLGNGLFDVRRGMGIINKKGEDVVEPIYDEIERLSNDFMITSINYRDKKGLLNPDAKVVLPVAYDSINAIPSEHFIVRQKDRWGSVDAQGNYVLPLDYKYIDYLDDGKLAVSKQGETMALADISGVILTDEKYQDIQFNTEGLFNVRHQDKWGMIDSQGNEIVSPQYEDIDQASLGLIAVKKTDKYGYIDINGYIKIDFKFDDASHFLDSSYSDKDGTAYVEMDGKAYYINTEGEIVRETNIVKATDARRPVESH